MNEDQTPLITDPLPAAEGLLRHAIIEAQKFPGPPREMAALADQVTRVMQRLRALEHSSPEAAFPLVQFDQGHDRGPHDQAVMRFNIGAAKASLSRLIGHALNGDVVVICRSGAPIVRIVPYHQIDAPAAGALTNDQLCAEDERDWFKPFADLAEEEE